MRKWKFTGHTGWTITVAAKHYAGAWKRFGEISPKTSGEDVYSVVLIED